MNAFFDVFDLGIYGIGICGFLLLIRGLVESLGAWRWWRLETWRERLARWNRQWSA